MRRALTRASVALVIFLLAAGVGFMLSSSLGQEFLRNEAKRQLTRLMRGPVAVEQVRLKLRLGIEIEADNLTAYPGPGGPGLSARRASARVDLLSLLLGRPRLRHLSLDRAHIRIEHLGRGGWSLPPLVELSRRAREHRERASSEDPLERHFALLAGIEKTARALLERPRLADRVELHHGSVTFIDGGRRRSDGRPLVFRLKRIEGELDHGWLSSQDRLHVRAVFKDDQDRSAVLLADGERRPGGDIRMSLNAISLEVATLDPYWARTGRPISATGKLTGHLSFEATQPLHGSIELDWSLQETGARRDPSRGQMQLESLLNQLRMRLEFSPDRLRLARAELAGAGLSLKLSGVAERPLRESSMARLSADLQGAGLEEVRRIVNSLPAHDREALSELFKGVESGRITGVGGSGSARVSQWRKLLAGDLSDLPANFVLTAGVEDLAVVAASGDRLSDVVGSVEWSGDRIDIRDGHGVWKGAALPELHLTIEGVSNLVAASRGERPLESGAEPLPGITTLWSLLHRDDEEAEPGGMPSLLLVLDALHHPALGRPLEKASVALESIPRGLQATLSEGIWGGAPVRGEAVYLGQPEPSLHITLALDSPQAGATREDEREDSTSREGTWAVGRFYVSPTEPGQLPFSACFGGFEIRRGALSISEFRAEFEPSGSLEAEGSLELDHPAEVPIEVSLQLKEADLAKISDELSAPPGLFSGQLSLQANLSGSLRSGEPLLAGLTGEASLEARDGRLGRELPLIVALAQAAEGSNPFSREAIRFEAIEATLALDNGRVATDDFELEGPIRMLISGWADVGRPSREIDAILGVFLFRQWEQVLGNLPLVKSFIPGSDKGLVGAYFEVSRKVGEPELTSLAVKSLADELPDILTTPLKAIRSLLMTKKPKSKRWDGPRPGLPESP